MKVITLPSLTKEIVWSEREPNKRVAKPSEMAAQRSLNECNCYTLNHWNCTAAAIE